MRINKYLVHLRISCVSERNFNNVYKVSIVVIQCLSPLDTSDKIKTKRGGSRSLSGSVGHKNDNELTIKSAKRHLSLESIHVISIKLDSI